MDNKYIFTVSVVIPTYNSSLVLDKCLESVASQNYPRDKIEIIIVDAFSKDSTLEIAKKYNASKILYNKLKTGEAGKLVGLKEATGDIVAFVDSDNILDGNDWLIRMVEPFYDDEIVASEPISYTYRKDDGYITKYSSLLGMNDPICLFLGNYDRVSVLTGKWTEMDVIEEDKGNYLKITLDEKNIPTIGANGFLIRRKIINRCDMKDYFFDIDVLFEILSIGKKENIPTKVAKVKIGIIHIFAGNIISFIKKQKRRIMDYSYFSALNIRKYPWKAVNMAKLIKFAAYTLLVFPVLTQSIIGYAKKRDLAWFFHPIACWITLIVYSWYRIKYIFVNPKILLRK